MKLTLNSIDNYADILKNNGITNDDLHRHCSDLYVGCRSVSQAKSIQEAIGSKAICSTFNPQKGSDMDQYQICLDIAFACVSLDFIESKPFITKYYYINTLKEKVYLTNYAMKNSFFSEHGALVTMGNDSGISYNAPVFIDHTPVIKTEYAWKNVNETDWIYNYEQQ